jgi:hypothetical protein
MPRPSTSPRQATRRSTRSSLPETPARWPYCRVAPVWPPRWHRWAGSGGRQDGWRRRPLIAARPPSRKEVA